MIIFRKAIYIIIYFSFWSCVSNIEKENLSGYWEQQGEGEIIEINDSIVISYYKTNFNCYENWKMPREEFNTEITVQKNGSFTSKDGYTIYTYFKLKDKPKLCQELSKNEKNSNSYNFETLWHTINENYPFFKKQKINWDSIKVKYQQQFDEKTEPFQFYLIVEKMISELNDPHSSFQVPNIFQEQWIALNQNENTYKNFVSAKSTVLNKYVSESKKYNGGALHWGLISEKLGYIQFNGMDGLADYGNKLTEDEYWEFSENSEDYEIDLLNGTNRITDSIINELKQTKACILDLRFNSGGYSNVGLAFLSHFINKKQDIYKKKRRYKNDFSGFQTITLTPSKITYNQDVYILTSPYTLSAAETTILASMNFSNFIRIGSNTKGAFSDIVEKELPNGWSYGISSEVYEGMNGNVYETIGIPPDFRIEYPRDIDSFFNSLNLELLNEDKAIEKVINLMK